MMYIYTARATGRKQVDIDGVPTWAFPLVYSFKPNLFDLAYNERMYNRVWTQMDRVRGHKDWQGYVSYEGKIYRMDDPWWIDSEELGTPVGEL